MNKGPVKYRIKTERNNPLMAQLLANKLTKQDVARSLGLTLTTWDKYVKTPTLIPLHRIIKLAGLFGLTPEQLVYLLLRNKPGNRDNIKDCKEHLSKWYDSIDKEG